MKLDAVAVVLDLVNPLRPGRRFALQGGQLGLNEARHLDTLNHNVTHKKTPPTATGGEAERRVQFTLSSVESNRQGASRFPVLGAFQQLRGREMVGSMRCMSPALHESCVGKSYAARGCTKFRHRLLHDVFICGCRNGATP